MKYPGVLIMDGSIRLTTGNFSAILSKALDNQGVLMFSGTGHSIYFATHPDMYDYFAVNVSLLKEVECLEAGIQLLYNTEYAYRTVLHWWYLCSLDPHCIAPENAKLGCTNQKVKFGDAYGDCHRLDQSAINILAVANHGLDMDGYWYSNRQERVAAIKRGQGASVDIVHTC